MQGKKKYEVMKTAYFLNLVSLSITLSITLSIIVQTTETLHGMGEFPNIYKSYRVEIQTEKDEYYRGTHLFSQV